LKPRHVSTGTARTDMNFDFDELYEVYVTATNEIATLKDENKVLQMEIDRLKEELNATHKKD
jgi:regulator of replication initiation timing